MLIDTGPHAAAAQKPDQIEAIFDWLPNAFAFDQARRAVELVFDALRPEGDLTPPNPDLGRMGEQFARGALVAIKDHEAGGELGDWAKPIRERLGALVDRINADPRDGMRINAIPPVIRGAGTYEGRIIDTHLGQSLINGEEK